MPLLEVRLNYVEIKKVTSKAITLLMEDGLEEIFPKSQSRINQRFKEVVIPKWLYLKREQEKKLKQIAVDKDRDDFAKLMEIWDRQGSVYWKEGEGWRLKSMP